MAGSRRLVLAVLLFCTLAQAQGRAKHTNNIDITGDSHRDCIDEICPWNERCYIEKGTRDPHHSGVKYYIAWEVPEGDQPKGTDCDSWLVSEGHVQCLAVPGYYCPKADGSPIALCPVGHYCKGGDHAPTPCQAGPGFYCPVFLCVATSLWMA